MKTGFKGQPIVQGAGHIMGTRGGDKIPFAKCAMYEDSEGNFYCTAELVPLEQWLKSYRCDSYIMN